MTLFPPYAKSRQCVFLSQYDPRWTELHLGCTTLKMGRDGCTTTALASLLGAMPEQMEKAIRYVEDPTKKEYGRIIWASVPGFRARKFGYGEADLKSWYMDPTHIAVIEVNKSHWVALDRFSPLGLGPLGMDPWGGTYINILKKYHTITGYALLTRNP